MIFEDIPIYRFFGAHFLRMMSLIVLTPKKTVLGLNHVIWAIKSEYRPRGSSWALKRENKDSVGQEKSQKGDISPICGEAPLKRSTSKIV